MSADRKISPVHSSNPKSPATARKVFDTAISSESSGHRRLSLAALLVAAVLILFVFFFPGKRLEGQAVRGEIDASPVGSEAIVLSGEWEIVEDSRDPAAAGTFAFLPAKWPKPYGYVSYRLRIRGLDPDRSYALAAAYMDTSYRLGVDGKVLLSGGSPGRTEAETRSALNTGIASLPAGATEAELLLEVANFVHLRGGPYRGILLGDESYLRRYDTWTFVTELVTIGIMVFLAGIAFLSAAFRRSPSSLWFGLMLVAGAAGLFFLSPDFPAFRIFPDLEWDAYVRLVFVIVYSVPLWFFLAARSLFGGFSLRSSVLIALPSAILALAALALQPKVFTAANLVYQLNSLALLALSAVIFGRAALRSYPYARPLGLGFATFLGIALSVLLFNNDRIYRGSFSVLSFLYPLFGITPSSSFALDVVSYLISLAGLNAFSIIFFVEAPKFERPSPELAAEGGQERTRAMCDTIGLSPREAEVVLLVLSGKRNKEIADALFVSENTVKTHLARIFAKAKVKARSELFAIFSQGRASA